MDDDLLAPSPTPLTFIPLREAMARPDIQAQLAREFETHIFDHPRELGDLMWQCYQASVQDATWLDRSILATQIAVQAEPESNKPAELLFTLGSRLSARSKLTGDMDDLNHAVVSYQHALELTPDGHEAQTERLNDLGVTLLARYNRTGDSNDLTCATVAFQSVADLLPDDDSHKPLALSNWGATLRERFKRLGELDDLENAILLNSRAVDLTPEGHSDLPSRSSGLGDALRLRFEYTGELEDLEQAIALHRHAVEITPQRHPDQQKWLTDLGLALFRHFERTGELEDLEQAISAHLHAVDLTPDGEPGKPLCLNNLVIALAKRFQHTEELEDLDQAIVTSRRAIENLPDGDIHKPSVLGNLCSVLLLRFQRTGNIDDHEQAILAQERALQLAPESLPNLPMSYNSLALCLRDRYERTQKLEDLIAAISTFNKAIALSSEHDPFLTASFANLAKTQNMLFEHTRAQTDFDAAFRSFMASTMHPSGHPSQHMDAATLCIAMLASNPAFSTREQLLSAHARIMTVLHEMVWLGHSVTRRFDESAKHGEVVSAAVATAIGAGALTQAVEWLEAGRSLIWSQVLSLRTPLGELRETHADLASALHAVQVQLQQSVHSSLLPDSMDSLTTANGIPGITANPTADRHRSLVVEYEKLLKQVRSCPGFEHFLRPKELAALVPSSQLLDGPVVFLNVHASRCDALIISSTGNITLVPLAQLSLKRATELSRVWVNCIMSEGVRSRASANKGDFAGGLKPLKNCLENMWSWIVGPVLQALEITRPVENERLPHVTWCPTGPLMQLPLHAAGLYNDRNGSRAHNLVVSSYTPSLSALKRSLDGLREPTHPRETLIVTQPATPYYAPLPGTVHEGARLQEILHASGHTSKLLNDRDATVGAVGAVLSQYPWVHLACHGSQDPNDATRSAFELFDGPLALSNLMGTTADDAELAFLSACQTAVGNDKMPEESAHLAAGILTVGFKGVIATMWSIQDADAPIVVEAFYKELLALRLGAGANGMRGTGAAHALHEATKVLREKFGEESFMRWVPFVHFGV